jgi:hypothetical protein
MKNKIHNSFLNMNPEMEKWKPELLALWYDAKECGPGPCLSSPQGGGSLECGLLVFQGR